ncbi:MAG: DUF6157 family protein [Bacteroidales bacterium]|nr:DUF6157 family protein [Bacteroidales bacterium]
MKIHTTNYFNALIEIAEDSTANCGIIPPFKGELQSVANIQFDLLNNNPYKYSSDDVVFSTYAIRNNLTESEMEDARRQFFSEGQACLRCSPLTKRYGWGIHSNDEGKIAIWGVESEEYERLLQDSSVENVKAMRSSRK